MSKLKELAGKYFLKQEDFWKCHDSWVLSHDAVEKIAAMEKIIITNIQVLNSEETFARFLISAEKKETKVQTIGEASKINCKSSYYGCMAEKRGIDRAVLKLINAYEYGIYSEAESDDFKKQNKDGK